MSSTQGSTNIVVDLRFQASHHPDSTALVHCGQAYSFRALNEAVNQAAAALHGLGIRQGDVVALSFKSELMYALTILANASLGATSMCISPASTPFQRASYAGQAKCNRFLADAALTDEPALPWQTMALGDLLRAPTTDSPFDASPQAPLLLAIGSGSTGEKKLMAISHAAMSSRCQSVMDDPVLQPCTRLLCLSGLAFISVINRLFNAIRAGITFVLQDDSVNDVFTFVEKHRVTALIVSVYHLEAMLIQAKGNRSPYVRNEVKAIRCVGSLLSEDLKRRVHDQLNPHIINSYATNESGVVCRTSLPAEFNGLPGVGRPLDHIQLQVVDTKGKVLGPGQRGLVRIASAGLIDGYLYNEEATRKAFKDGWFYPGDVGELTPQGHLLYHGRVDRMMILNGVNIFPSEIELALTAHPWVSDCIAFPVKDPVAQDVPVCAVALKPGAPTQEAELLRHAANLLGFSRPRRVFILPHMPKTVEGKIELPKVIAMVTAQLG